MRRFFWCVIPVSSVFLNACQFFDSTELPVSYIQVEDISIAPELSQGAATKNITDIWLYVDDELAGVFPVQSAMPVLLKQESQRFQFLAGIRRNGIQSSPSMYPFYKDAEIEMQLSEGQIEPISLQFSYHQSTIFKLLEEFEGNHSFHEDIDGDPGTILGVSDQDPRTGNSSGFFFLDKDHRLIEVASQQVFSNLPVDGSPIYLEIDYKNEGDLLVGLQGISQNGSAINFYKLVLKPSEEWNKVYIDFTQDIIDSGLSGFRILLGASIADSSANQAEIFIDNLKLLHL